MITFSIIHKSHLEGTHRLDAEYYQPQYLQIVEAIQKSKQYKQWTEIDGKFITGPFGSEFNVENYSSERKYRYVRGKDVKQFFLEDDDNVYIPEKDFDRLKKYNLQAGDILISVVGTNGNTVVVDRSVPPAIFSCKSTTFRTKAIDSFYLIAFLNSRFGQQQLERSVRGALQTGLNIDDLKSILLYVPKKEVQESIGKQIESAKAENERSKALYAQAESLLLEELGLKDNEIQDDLSFVVQLSDVKNAHRVDAEYFQPKYKKLREVIEKKKYSNLLKAAEAVPANFIPKAEETCKYVELADINSSIGIVESFSQMLGKEAPSRARRKLRENDVIVSSIEGSLEKVALVRGHQSDYLASTGFFQFRVKKMSPEVLLVIAKSPVLQMQLKQRTTGTILTAVAESALEDVIVPLLPNPLVEKITELVRQSHEARKKSKELLEEAKRKVEEMIERQAT